MGSSFDLRHGSPFHGDPRWFFSRPVATADLLGERLAPHQLRFGRPCAIAGLPGPEELIEPDLGTGSTIFHAGVDLDGQTPVLLVLDGSRRLLLVYRENGGAMELVRSVPGTFDAPGDFFGMDILGQAVSGCPVGTRAFEPGNGLVVHGTIVLLCRVHTKTSPTNWQIQGVGVCYSTDGGASWTRYFDDLDDPRDAGRTRIAGWELTNYYCPHYTPGKPLLEVFVPFADYRLAGSPNPSRGGRAFWFKMRRKSVHQPFVPLWSGAPGSSQPRVGRYTIDTNPAGGAYVHMHACGITEFFPVKGKPGIQIIAALGDQVASSMVRIIIRDPDRYWDRVDAWGQPNWLIRCNWHGRADSNVIDGAANDGAGGPGTGFQLAGDATPGNQFVGCAPGPRPGTLMLGADARGEGMWLLEPGHAPDSLARFSTLVSDHGAVNRSNCFFFRCDRPELAKRTYCCDMMISPYRGPRIVPRSVDGFWFSRDHGDPATWGFVSMEGYLQRYGLVNDTLYLLRLGGRRLVRIGLPELKFGRPLQIGPGGGQWLRDDLTRQYDAPGELVRCLRGPDGRWMKPRDDGSPSNEPIDPQPPTCCDNVWRIAKTLEDPGGGPITYFIPSETHPRVGSQVRQNAPFDPGLEPRTMRLRMWILNRSGADNPTSPPILRGRSPTQASVRIFYDAGPGAVQQLDTGGVFSNDRWEAIVRVFNAPLMDGERFGLAVAEASNPNDGDFYLAISDFSLGYGCFGYPMPPDLPHCCPDGPPPLFVAEWPSATNYPNEHGRINLDKGLTPPWTLLAAGLVPIDSWDQYSLHQPDNAPYRVLTLADADEQRWLTLGISPRIDLNKFSEVDVRYRSPATPTELQSSDRTGMLPFLRARPVYFAVVCNSAGMSVYTAAAGLWGNPISIPVPSLAAGTFTRLELGSVGLREVAAFQWFGLKTLNQALDANAVREEFRTLGFVGT